MNRAEGSKRGFPSHFLAALCGGAVVLAGALTLDLVGSETTETTVIRQAPISGSNVGNVSNGKALTAGEIYEKSAPGVVFITAEVVQRGQSSPFGFDGRDQESESTGSGFVIDKNGSILTNAHVIAGASKVTVSFTDKRTVEAKVLGKDVSNDIALLKVDPKGLNLKPLTMGDSRNIKVGDPTVAIGNPFGLDRTLTTGVVSALQRKITAPNGFTIEDVIQTDAAINPGNSGGPLLDAAGRVIGINSQIATGSSGNGSVGIGFAVPINTAKSEIEALRKNGRADHAFLGLSGLTLDQELKNELNLASDRGVLVQTLDPDGPAAKAGIKSGSTTASRNGESIVLGGDVILKFAGKDVATMEEIVSAVNDRKPGDVVEVQLIRNGKSKTVSVKLGTRPNTDSL